MILNANAVPNWEKEMKITFRNSVLFMIARALHHATLLITYCAFTLALV